MTINNTGRMAKKTSHRMQIVDGIMDALSSNTIYGVIGDGLSEGSVKTFMYQPLLAELTKLYARLDPRASEGALAKRAKKSLLWEGNIKTTVNNILFMGAMHRPDFVVQTDNIHIAIEVKRGDNGAAVRSALGQCLVYASQYDFSCCLFVDTSNDKKIKHGLEGSTEQLMIDRLWKYFNVRFNVV